AFVGLDSQRLEIRVIVEMVPFEGAAHAVVLRAEFGLLTAQAFRRQRMLVFDDAAEMRAIAEERSPEELRRARPADRFRGVVNDMAADRPSAEAADMEHIIGLEPDARGRVAVAIAAIEPVADTIDQPALDTLGQHALGMDRPQRRRTAERVALDL